MRCERHSWDSKDAEWCWKCEELTIEENKRKYEESKNKYKKIGVEQKYEEIEINND